MTFIEDSVEIGLSIDIPSARRLGNTNKCQHITLKCGKDCFMLGCLILVNCAISEVSIDKIKCRGGRQCNILYKMVWKLI